MAHIGFCLLLRDSSSFLLLHDGASTSGLLLHEQGASGGSSISGGTFSRGRWRKMVEEVETARQLVIEQRDRERQARITAKRKARAEAETVRKAKAQAEQTALAQRIQSVVGGSRVDAASAARTFTGTLENLRLGTLAAYSARKPPAPAEPAPKPNPLALIQDLMKRTSVEDMMKNDAVSEAMKRDLLAEIMKHDLVSEVLKRDMVSDVMKRNKDKYGLN